MFLLPLHVDRHLARLASSGTLPPRQWRRTLRHARACARCGPRYERVMHLRRVWAQDTVAEPTPAELESVAARGLEAALASAAGGRTTAPGGRQAWLARGREWLTGGPWWGAGRAWALAAVAAGALLLLAVPREQVAPVGLEAEWGVRGDGDSAAVLRLFCVPEDSALREVKGEGACPPGAALAFAAGVRAPLTHAVVVVRGAGGTRLEGPFEVRGPPGAEAALDVTPRLPTSGDVEVTAVFAPSAQAALAAARGEPAEGAVRVQHRVRVEATP
ncbi:hypothetical protein [Corallococcus exercitus]|uniref:Zf-HC2 domain-containing protein n=1 Tax=Corallococcus exercitus TaxID=2316736 RepID=A0A7Y4JZP5_9BACT|nr:hypothetical protein [Corallococcus exercitus]NOK14209.1 hypothetical protein [Corallococcus exercitus]